MSVESQTIASSKSRRRVLIVDDEPGMRYMARRVLESRFHVAEAASGEEALELLEQRSFHFAIVDVRLPGLNGLELLTRIKEQRPETDVVVMTGSAHDPDESLEDSIRRKAFFFLRKPFPFTLLQTLADRIVESQEMSETLDRQIRRLESDLDAARKFQRQLLPEASWSGRGVAVSSLFIPSERLSGDFLDYWALPCGSVAVLVADVMGHGPSAAMITGILKSQAQRSLASSNVPDPAKAFAELDEEFMRSQISVFFTAFLLIIGEREVRFCGAGHPPLLGRSATGTFFEVESTGIPINMGIPSQRSSTVRPRRPGERYLLLTDGYNEGPHPSEDRFFGETYDGVNALHEGAKEALAADDPTEGLDRLEGKWREYTGGSECEDDRAAVIVHIESI